MEFRRVDQKVVLLWLKEHFADPYVKEAQRFGLRSRAVFKLIEIQKKDRIIKPGMTVVDLGSAPGGWSQYAAQRSRKSGVSLLLIFYQWMSLMVWNLYKVILLKMKF